MGLLKATRSWLRCKDVKITRRVKVSNPNRTPTIEDEKIPSKEELSRIFRASSPRVRVSEALMAFADLRPQTLGNHDGSDGLVLGDLPELQIDSRLASKNLLGIDLLEVKVAKERELRRRLSRDEEIELFENEIKKMRESETDPQTIVREGELELASYPPALISRRRNIM